MKLNYLTIQVSDLSQSVAFYEQLVGLQVVRRFLVENGEIAFLVNQKDETMLELIQIQGLEKVSAQGLVLSFLTTNALESLRQKAQEMGYETSEIISYLPKPTYFRVLDPNGLIVEFSNA